MSADPSEFIDINGTLFFVADDGSNGRELWKSDGTTIGTQMVKNINTQANSNPTKLTDVDGMLYFTANDGLNGVELWRSDGTEEGTELFANLTNGNTTYADIGTFNGLVVFSAYIDDLGFQLFFK